VHTNTATVASRPSTGPRLYAAVEHVLDEHCSAELAVLIPVLHAEKFNTAVAAGQLVWRFPQHTGGTNAVAGQEFLINHVTRSDASDGRKELELIEQVRAAQDTLRHQRSSVFGLWQFAAQNP
jgi:hypothetical protein